MFQRCHGVITFIQVFFFDENAQRNIALRAGREPVFNKLQITGHQRKQVAGFAERIFPADPVPAVIKLTMGDIVAIGQQDRVFLFISNDGGGEDRHHIGPVQVVGNFAETLGFALRAEHRARLVQPFQAGIFLRLDQRDAFQHKTLVQRLIGQG